MRTLEVCLVPAFTLPNIAQRVTNMCMVLVVVLVVLHTKTSRVILVHGTSFYIRWVLEINPFFYLIYRQLLLCRVALGKSFLQFSAMKMAHAPPGHHSVIGRPSAGGLHFPEYVVYRGEQVMKFEWKFFKNKTDLIFPCRPIRNI